MIMTEVKVGQIWKDNDKRVGDRQIEIVAINDSENKAVVVNLVTKKTTKVSLKRFRPISTGYTLIKDVD